MSKVFKNFVGIDISKHWFDAVLITPGTDSKSYHQQFKQTIEGFKKLRQWLSDLKVNFDHQTLICMEYTGIYNTGLVEYLVGLNAALWVEMPLRIKKAGGLQRGGDDKSDACKIAWYAARYSNDARTWQPIDSNIEKIKHLTAQRDRIMTAINNLLVPVEELRQCGCIEQAKQLQKLQLPSVKALQKAKENIEATINQTIKKDCELSRKAALIQSVNGIGEVTAIALLIYTKGFTTFESAKDLACYCGVVPFNKTSGSSVRYKPGISPFANMRLKKLLHLCAMSAIKNDDELRTYFERKVAEGKNKMSVLNAVRNKLVHRVFAVVRDNRSFEENYVRQCA